MEPATIIDEQELPALLEAFYSRARSDALIGPVFNGAVKDWPHHLDQIADFWSSVMLATGRYQGRPMMKHLVHAERITPEMFDRWLLLWARTTDEMLPPKAASAMQERAHRIAASLKAGVMRQREYAMGPG